MAKINKILSIITQSSWGGAQKYVYTLAQNLSQSQEWEIVVAGGQESLGELVEKLNQDNIRFVALINLVREISPLKDLKAILEIKKLIEIERPDIIHLNSSKAGAVGSLAARLAKHQAKVIYTVHGWVFKEKLNFFTKIIYWLIEKSTAGFKDLFILISESDRQAGRSIIGNKKTAVIYNGIDADRINFLDPKTARQELIGELPTNQVLIGAIANFFPNKGLKYLIEAAKILKNDGLNFKIIIIGDGAIRNELERQIKNYGLTADVLLVGAKVNAAAYLKAFDIYVISSLKEGLPFSLLEAMAAGLPIITTDVGGIKEIITDQKNGLLIKPAKPQELAEKIKYLLNNRELADQLARQAQIDVKEKFSLQAMLEKTWSEYQNLIF